ncbi:AAA family ATPase [Desulfuromonas sp. TF]|uniref:AAA family ATPase n=1 Tax=Desulfuromonas sp. TF TaxID=1232410 RepID=UPI0004856BB3|nr:AAA family ATPase [Desulfuromonas sp. TF]
MCKKIFVAATGQNCGKTTTCLSILHMARKRHFRVGFIKPVGPKPTLFSGALVDKDAALMAQVYGLGEDLEFMSPVVLQPGSTRKILDGEIQEGRLLEMIERACAEMERQCDFLVIEGAGHSGVGSVVGLSNARLARVLNAPVLMVTGRGIGSVVDQVSMNLALFRQEGAHVGLIMPNKLIPEKRSSTLRYLRTALGRMGLKVEGGFNYHPVLANPTLQRLSRVLDAPLAGDPQEGQRIVDHVQLGAASAQRVADLLLPSTLIVVTSSRDELLVMLASLHQIPEYREKIAGIVISGLAPVSRVTRQILDGSGVPYLRVRNTTAEAFAAITGDIAKISAEDHAKIGLVQSLAETEMNFAAVESLAGGHEPAARVVGFR